MDTATKAIAAEAAEKKMQKRTGAAYSKALTSTEEKPDDYKADYDSMLKSAGEKLDRNKVSVSIDPYLKPQADKANAKIQDNMTTLRRQRQESTGVGAGQGTRGTDAGEMGNKWSDMFE